MQYDALLNGIDQAVYERMLFAVETGRWPDGVQLTQAQRENTMQLVMLYQARKLKQKDVDHFTVNEQGELVVKTKQDMRKELREKARLSKKDPFSVETYVPTKTSS